MDSRTWVPTPNADVIYAMSYLDLKQTGPLVVNAPAQVIDMFTDFFQRTITDVGAVGPNRGRGGLFLLLPPGYDGHVPGGYYTFSSLTYNVFLFFRTVMGHGDGKPDPAPAVALAEQTRVFPLWTVEKDVEPMQFPNASGIRLDMMYPTDFAYWASSRSSWTTSRSARSTKSCAACSPRSGSSRESRSNRPTGNASSSNAHS